MKLDEWVAIHVGNSALDPASVRGFLQTAPQYHAWGLTHQIEPTGLTQLAAADLVTYYLRMYLIGRHKTLRACFRETQAFARQDSQVAHYLLIFSLDQMRQALLGLEWYELLPRLVGAQERILALVPSVDSLPQPGLVDVLIEYYELSSRNHEKEV
ncbi:hypothetical protein [Spirosoma endophyticum]|uniref:Uncharacterized protein n=1 Tax=Spirosoma endophyticum TaxID=662367 RepID=A0A1I2G7U0_9BACT|nr:hypothetical protein [Spirosoma endophyticum]SFF12681.1 hypothetical protein SAMN05216167_1303 [Spirosoma endophyticum]